MFFLIRSIDGLLEIFSRLVKQQGIGRQGIGRYREQLWKETTLVNKGLNCKPMAVELEEAQPCSDLIMPQSAFRAASTKQIRAIISSKPSKKAPTLCCLQPLEAEIERKVMKLEIVKSVVVDVVFYAEGNSRVSVEQTCAIGISFPYAVLRELKKKRNIKASTLHIVLILVLGGRTAKVKSNALREELAGFRVLAKARTEMKAARLCCRVLGRVCGCWKSNLAGTDHQRRR